MNVEGEGGCGMPGREDSISRGPPIRQYVGRHFQHPRKASPILSYVHSQITRYADV